MRIRSITVGVISAIVLLAGCGGGGGATGTPTATPPSSQSSEGGGDKTEHGAPKVKTPLEYQSAKSNPCGTITTAQLQALGIDATTGKPNPGVPGAACIWHGAGKLALTTPGVAFVDGGNGLDTLYQQKDTLAVFEVVGPVQGFPAVIASPADLRSGGDCDLSVGVADNQTIAFSMQMSNGAPRFSDPCGLLTEFANQVITNIKAGAK